MSTAYYTYEPVPADDAATRKGQQGHEVSPLLASQQSLPPNNGRNIVVVHESPSRDVCLMVLYGCCIFWILFVIVLLILVICYEAGAFGDDDYSR